MPNQIIKSIKDDKIVFARKLQQKKGRIEEKHLLAEGWEQILWVMENHLKVKYLLLHDKIDAAEVRKKLPDCMAEIYTCSDGILKKVTNTNYLIPVVAVVKMNEGNLQNLADLCIVLDGVQDFGNIGTIIRTAAAFGIHDFAATSLDFDLHQRKTIDASRGTVFSTQCTSYTSPSDAIQHLKKSGFQVVATALEGSKIQSLAKLDKKPVAIVFGNETSGVSKEVLNQADLCIQIPMATELDSLNVGVAAGISLYELKLKMVLMMLNEKIQGSLGRNLTATSRWLRRLFDKKLRAVSDITAEQAVILMILACDKEGEKRTLLQMAGIESANKDAVFSALISSGYLLEMDEKKITITEKGEELLGKIWNIHEQVENIAFKGFKDGDKERFLKFLTSMQANLEQEITYE
ncbi:MAG: hypothetical protein Tsb0021_07620 [Chlamydiales bacterium]